VQWVEWMFDVIIMVGGEIGEGGVDLHLEEAVLRSVGSGACDMCRFGRRIWSGAWRSRPKEL
jgi:hypothetical protein